jgi:hypothetical protein
MKIHLQHFSIPCFSAKTFAESIDLAEHATTLAVGNNFNACVKSCEILPQPINPHRSGGHSNGLEIAGSSNGGGGGVDIVAC